MSAFWGLFLHCVTSDSALHVRTCIVSGLRNIEVFTIQCIFSLSCLGLGNRVVFIIEVSVHCLYLRESAFQDTKDRTNATHIHVRIS